MARIGDKPEPSGRAEIYDVPPTTRPAPPLPGDAVVAETADELIDLVAADLLVQAKYCVGQLGDFQLALCGGATPQSLYKRLMYDPNFRQLPWPRTHLWLVDERCLPLDDQRSNFRMINETIVDHSGIPAEQVHPMPGLSATADVDYERTLREVLEWRERGEDRLDFILLEMGAGGEVAGLFPHTEPLREARRLVRFNAGPEPASGERLTMTFPLINAARFIAVLVTGEAKAATLERVSTGRASADELPIKGVRPINGELKWYLDTEACGDP